MVRAGACVCAAGNNFSATPLRSVLKNDPTRGRALLAVSVDAGTMNAKFEFDAGSVPRPTDGVRVLFEGTAADAAGDGRLVPVVDGTGAGWAFVDHFSGFDSHVYVLG